MPALAGMLRLFFMMANSNQLIPNRIANIFFLLLICLLPYSNTFSHEWHLDDRINIHSNQALHPENLHITSVASTFFAHPVAPGTLYRPISNLSFALNWLLGQDAALGYHATNIAIHFFTAIGLYLSCLLLLQSPTLRSQKLHHIPYIALLAAIFWALSPIQTQAVTYIVQRMAQLAALFTVFAIYFFLNARLSHHGRQRFFSGFCCLCCFLLALGSKENAIMLPFSLLLLEGIFFRQISLLSSARKNILSVSLLILSLAGGLIFLIHAGFLNFDYSYRTFTLAERVLTEPRILIFYLSQLYFPSSEKLSIAHNIVLSNSILTPWTTLPALISCFTIIVLSLIFSHSYPLLCFSALFYFSNHLIESTIIPLELIFEHRNYQPSLFLFLPVSSAVISLLNSNQSFPKFVKYFIIILFSSFLIYLGHSTYKRNEVWATEESLWLDALQKAPNDARAMINLAGAYTNQGKFEEAFTLCHKAGMSQSSTSQANTSKALSLNCQGTISYYRGECEKALLYFEKALFLRNDYNEVSEKLISLYIDKSMYSDALSVIMNKESHDNSLKLQTIKQFVLLMLDMPQKSLEVSYRIQKDHPSPVIIAIGQGKALSMLGFHENADLIFRYAASSNDLRALLLQIENNLLDNKIAEAESHLKALIDTFPLSLILQEINNSILSDYPIPYNKALLTQAIKTATHITSRK